MKAIVEKEMDKLLKQRGNYTYIELCKYFNIENHYDLMKYLGSYLEKKLDHYNFENNVKNNKYLSKTMRYFDYSLGKIDLEQNHDLSETIEIINKIIDKIEHIITSNINRNSNQTEIDNSIFLLVLENQLKNAVSTINNRIDNFNKLDTIYDNKLLNIVKDVIFRLKNIPILEMLFENFKNIILLKEENHTFVFNKVLDTHFNNLLNRDDYHDKIYFDKVIDLYTKYAYLTEKSTIEEEFYSKIQKFMRTVSTKVEDEKKKSYIVADINERIRQFEVGSEVDFLTEKANDNYYSNISFDTINNLIGQVGKDIKRTDMTNRHIITIDNPDAKVLENALSVEIVDHKYLLSIYVVDIASFILKNKSFEKKRYDEILHNKMNTKLFSSKYRYQNLNLLENKEMPVIAYDFLIDEDFSLSSFCFQRATIKVGENLKFTDFNNKTSFKNKKTKDIIENLSDLVYPYLQEYVGKNKKTIDSTLRLINVRLAREIAKYTLSKNLPLIYTNYNIENVKSLIKDIEELYSIDLSFMKKDKRLTYQNIYTIGNDEKRENSDLNISIFSPTRKVNALMNQMLINIYLVDHEKIDDYTKNYIETRLDKIATNINRKRTKYNEIDNYQLADIKQYVKK